MQRALGTSEPPGAPVIKLEASQNKVTATANALKKETPQLDKPQKKDIPATAESKIKATSAPGSPQVKSTPPKQETTPKTVKGPQSQKVVSPASGQDGQKTGQKPPDMKSNTTTTTQEESKGFFRFGGPKPQPDSAKPAELLGGKMFGFGSSVLSSASTLLKSAVQDEEHPHTTDTTKTPQPKSFPMLQTKPEKASTDHPKDETALSAVPKAVQSTCPLCKVELKEPSHYNNCTECKKNVCNQCGFNPMPNMVEVRKKNLSIFFYTKLTAWRNNKSNLFSFAFLQVKEWLCLSCQMQRALQTTNSANKMFASTVHPKITHPNQMENQNKELSKSDAPLKTDTLVAKQGSPQKPKPTALTLTTNVTKGSKGDTQSRPTPVDIVGASSSQKLDEEASQTKSKELKASQDTQQDSGKLFGLSSSKTGPDSAKSTESVAGKMFGFGSSIFSSASTLISSAVQEESRTTPPSSRKMSAPAQVSPKLATKTPLVSPARHPKTEKVEQIKKPEEPHLSIEENAPSQPPPMATVTQKEGRSCCPLCKAELNIGSKDPANYNTCTECKTTVCNQCGFNPMPIGKVS